MSDKANIDHSKKHPAYTAFHVQEINHEKKFWTRIGVAWKHKDGKGFDVQLNGLAPLDGRIVLREPDNQ
jgi:hypothetical protein